MQNLVVLTMLGTCQEWPLIPLAAIKDYTEESECHRNEDHLIPVSQSLLKMLVLS